MGKVKEMAEEIRGTETGGMSGDRKVLAEAAKALLAVNDMIGSVTTETGLKVFGSQWREAAELYGRSGNLALALKAMADRGTEAEEGYWELMVRDAYTTDEAPVTVACRTVEKARKLMEEDIRETLAGHKRFTEADVTREDENTAALGNWMRWEIEWKPLKG